MPAEKITPGLRSMARPIATLKSDPANVRAHGEQDVNLLSASLARFGQQKPIVIDSAGVVIAGNGTLEAARRLGWKKVAVVRSDLAGVDRVGYAIADNRLAELSRWDQPALKSVLGAMPADVAAAAGFGAEDLAAIAAGDDELNETAPVAQLKAAVTKRGDVWLLGQHRLMCGDSTHAGDVDRLMAGKKAVLCATDPPYLVDYTGVRAGQQGKDWSAAYRENEIKDAGTFFRRLFTNVLRVTSPGSAIYCWHAHKRIGDIKAAWADLGILDHQEIVWVKPTPVFGSVFWHFRHEPCLMGWRQGSKPPHDGRHDEDSVWSAGGPKLEDMSRDELLELLKASLSVWEANWEGSSRPVGNEHPTQKPLEIFARPIRKHTKPGDLVFEPFSGSGSQMIAAEKLGRRCYAMELEPVFVEVAVRRWEQLTGKKAERQPAPAAKPPARRKRR